MQTHGKRKGTKTIASFTDRISLSGKTKDGHLIRMSQYEAMNPQMNPTETNDNRQANRHQRHGPLSMSQYLAGPTASSRRKGPPRKGGKPMPKTAPMSPSTGEAITPSCCFVVCVLGGISVVVRFRWRRKDKRERGKGSQNAECSISDVWAIHLEAEDGLVDEAAHQAVLDLLL